MLQITKKDTTANTMVGQKMNRQFTKKAILQSRRQGKKKKKYQAGDKKLNSQINANEELLLHIH